MGEAEIGGPETHIAVVGNNFINELNSAYFKEIFNVLLVFILTNMFKPGWKNKHMK